MNKTRKIGLSLVGAVASTLMAYNVVNDFRPTKNLWGDLHGFGRCDVTDDTLYFGHAVIWYTKGSGLLVSPRALGMKDLSKKTYEALIERDEDPSSTNPEKIEELNKKYVKVYPAVNGKTTCNNYDLIDVFGADPGRYLIIEEYVVDDQGIHEVIVTDPSRRIKFDK